MMQEFIQNKYQIVEFNADKKSRQMLRKVKEINSDSILVAVRMLCTSSKTRTRKDTRNRFNFRD